MRRAFFVGIAGLIALLGTHGPATAREAPDVTPLFAAVFGVNVLGPGGDADAGDPDARGALSMVTPGPEEVCFGLNVLDMAKVTSVELREGTTESAGPVLLRLTPVPGSEIQSSGCVSDAPASVVANLRAHPERFYLNVATTEFPDGAARGQFFGTPTGGRRDAWLLYVGGAGLLLVGVGIGILAGRRTARSRTEPQATYTS
jgi:CHRD domain-containing protein